MGAETGRNATRTNESAAAAASTEPTNADLAAILSGEGAAAPRKRTAPAAEADAGDEGDEGGGAIDGDADDDADLEDKPAKKKPAKAKAAGEDEFADDADDKEKPAAETVAEEGADGEEGEQGEGDDADDETLTDEEKAAKAKEKKEAEDVAALRDSFTEEQQAAFDKAIGKKVKKTIELRKQLTQRDGELARLQAALDEAEARTPGATIAATADNPLGDVETETALEERLSAARRVRRWAQMNRDGGKLGDQELDAEGVSAAYMAADELIEEHAPKQRALLQKRGQLEAAAVKAYPWLADRTHASTRAVDAELKRMPQLRALFPGARLMVADLLEMAKIRTARAAQGATASRSAATTTADKTARRAPASPAGGTRPVRILGATKAAGAATKNLEQTGDDAGNAALRAVLGL